MKTIPVKLIGDEACMYFISKQLKFLITLDGVEYFGYIRENKKADGNSTPWFISPLLKPNGPHVDTGNIHDSLYEEPVIYECATEKPRRLTRRECDHIHFYFLRHDTGLLDETFEASPSLFTKLWYWIRFKKPPKVTIKDRICNMTAARLAYGGLIIGGWIAWWSWRRKEKKRENDIQVHPASS